MSDPTGKAQEQITVDVSSEVAFTMKLQEFDRNIAIAEAKVAELKMNKAVFIYDTNLNNVVASAKAAQQTAPADSTAPAADETPAT